MSEESKTNMTPYIIGYVCAENPFKDRKAWSGSLFKIRESIERAGFKVQWIPYKKDSMGVLFLRFFIRLMSFLSREKIFGGVHNPSIVHYYAKSINMTLVNSCDYLFFPGGAQIALYLKSPKPVINYTDATVHCMINYYWKGYNHKSIEYAKRLEENAAQRCFLNIRSSDWAKDSLINDCHADPKTCYVLEFGPNIDEKDITPTESYCDGPLNILFSGVDWDRKGGDIAIETVQILRKKGIDAHLTIVGPDSFPEYSSFVNFVGFLNKNSESDYKKYLRLFRDNHLFLLPTKAECAGIVFCEASAFGLPCYTYATGGTTNYVVNGVNGYAFPLGSPARTFADQIFQDIQQQKLSTLSKGALRLSKEKLSWEVWSENFRSIIDKS